MRCHPPIVIGIGTRLLRPGIESIDHDGKPEVYRRRETTCMRRYLAGNFCQLN
jgi:hypothetical protein